MGQFEFHAQPLRSIIEFAGFSFAPFGLLHFPPIVMAVMESYVNTLMADA
jgi:hypothetical protein